MLPVSFVAVGGRVLAPQTKKVEWGWELCCTGAALAVSLPEVICL